MVGVDSARAELLYIGDPSGGNFLGAITPSGSGYEAHPFLVTGLKSGVSVSVFSYQDMLGRDRVLVNEYTAGSGNDVLSIYDPMDWSRPVHNTKAINCYSINGAAAAGRYLYITCSQKFVSNGDVGTANLRSGSVIKLDMEDGYREVVRYNFEGLTDGYRNSAETYRRGQDIYVRNGKVYVLSMSYKTSTPYDASEIFCFNENLDLENKAWIEESSAPDDDSWTAGRNVNNMAFYEGNFYIAATGGTTGDTSKDGAIWKVTADDLTVTKLLTISEISRPTANMRGFHRISISNTGVVFLVGYDYASSNYYSVLMRATVADLDAGVAPNVTCLAYYDGAPGRVDLIYDEDDGTFWYMANRRFAAYGEDGILRASLAEDQHKGTNNTVAFAPVERLSLGDGSGGGDGAPSGCSAGVWGLVWLLVPALRLRRCGA
jgi:hypothetical protein